MKPIEEMSFEEALAELEKLVNSLDSGDVPLEQSVALYERGEKLKKHCEEKINAAELRVREISKTEAGISAKPVSDFNS